MKLSFSTLGCPDWTIDEICERGGRYGFDGVEIRGILGEFDLPRCEALGEGSRTATLGKFSAAGLRIAGLGTSVRLCMETEEEREKNIADGEAAVDLAADLETDRIRIFGGNIPGGVSFDTASQWVVDGLKRLGDYGGKRGVLVALETHDSFIGTAVLRDIMGRADNVWVGVLWDVHHPYRMKGESMRESWENIGPFVIHTHFKDSEKTGKDDYRLTLTGEGDVPIADALLLLKSGGYGGYLSLEWEKAWHPELPDATEAFPQYVERMKDYLRRLP